MMLLSVFACSAAVLSFEVLLTRLFSITQWNHLSFMVISIAMLGTGASAVFVGAAGDRPLLGGPQRLLPASVALLPPALLAGFEVAARTRIDYFQLALDPWQLARLAILFVVLAVPFALAGLVTALAYSARAPSRVYLAAMAGSAAGALAPAALLPLVGLAAAFVLTAALPAAPAVARAWRARRADWRPLAAAAAPLPVAALLLAVPALTEVRPNEYKALSHLMATPGVARAARHDTLRARYDEVSGEAVRYAPGLSLRYTDSLPRQRLIFEDGDRPHMLLDPDDPRCDLFARSLLAYGATLAPPQVARTLVLHADGGGAAVVARAAGARVVEVVTDQRLLAGRFAGQYGAFARVTCASARAFLQAPGDAYDLIMVESHGTQLPAMASLAVDRWLTVEGLQAMLWRLAPGGVLAFNRALDLPPNDLLRLLNTSWQALGVGAPQRHTAALRSWDTLLLIVSREPLGAAARQRLRSFADRMRFDLVQMEGLTAEEGNRYNQMARPFHFEAAEALAAGTLDPDSPFDVSALTDARPYPYHFLRWTRLPVAWRLFGDRLYSVMLSGEVMLLLVLVAAVAASALILMLPGRLARRPAPARRSEGSGRTLWFAAVGAGYMFCEIGWLDSLGLLLESPTLAFAAAVGGLLLASGPGGILGERARRLEPSLAAAAVVTLGLAVLSTPASRWLLPQGAGARAAEAMAALALCGVVMGVAFPLGLRRLVLARPGGHPEDRIARAWAANGASSVVASVVAPIIAMSWGSAALFVCAAACYAFALAEAVLVARRQPLQAVAPPDN